MDFISNSFLILEEVNDIIDADFEVVNSDDDQALEAAKDKQYALAQVYEQTTNAILQKQPNNPNLSSIEVRELITLFNNWQEESQKAFDESKKDLDSTDDLIELSKMCQLIRDKIVTFKDEKLKEKVKPTKEIEKKSLDFNDFWAPFASMINAKLPKSLYQAVMYSNPLTALIDQNMDLISNPIKTIFTKNTKSNKNKDRSK